MAGRASVEFYVGLALKARGQRGGKSIDVIENAFVIRVFRNGLAVFVSSYVPAFFFPFSFTACTCDTWCLSMNSTDR